MKSAAKKKTDDHRGIIFNNMFNFLLLETKAFASESDFFVKTINHTPDLSLNPSLTSGHQIFRDLRKGPVPIAKVEKFFSKYLKKLDHVIPTLRKHQDEIHGHPVGEWGLVLGLVQGLRKDFEVNDPDQEILNYLTFIEELCLEERDFITSTSKQPHEAQLDRLSEYATQWFGLDDISFDAKHINIENHPENAIQYTISTVLYQAALVEYFTIIDWSEALKDKKHLIEKSLLNDSLPRKVGEKLLMSNACYFEGLKRRWANHKGESKLSNNQFYEEILIKEGNPEGGNIETQKKFFQRWCKSESADVIALIKKLSTLAECEIDDLRSRILSILYVKLFDKIQRELLQTGVSENEIITLFSRYPDYLQLVENQFSSWLTDKKHGQPSKKAVKA